MVLLQQKRLIVHLYLCLETDKMIKINKGKEFSNLVPQSKTHIIKERSLIILENPFEMREKVAEFLK